MKVGLRIDVDTFRGTKCGVPNMLKLLGDHSISASFFFSVGPDNMGRHLWRLIRPAFFLKILRTKATSLYGWDILLKGTLWQGPVIGEKLAHLIHAVANAGHEVGFHAWDHHAWQVNIERMDSDAIYRDLDRGIQSLTRILGHPPTCSAVPAWKCNDRVLLEKARFPFVFNSDCRGKTIFRPFVRGKVLSQPQIPVTLPTYDEMIGKNCILDANYNDYMLSLLRPEELNVLTIHAEVEGISRMAMFDRFVRMAKAEGASFVPLGTLLRDDREPCLSPITPGEFPGREGWASCQGRASLR
jgi:undecaprenyl phosphate-alpha-L-ara4FN deformylase